MLRYLRVAIAAIVAAVVPGAAAPVSAADDNWFEWLAVAPIVITGDVLDAKDKAIGVRVEQVIRGDLSAGDTIHVGLRRANRERDRDMHSKSLELKPGERWILLLQSEADGAAAADYGLVRGVSGARPLPGEGAEALVQALRTFVEIRSVGEEEAWRRLEQLLAATDPLLVDTALQLHLKFRRGDLALLPDLRPLLDHPAAEIRERTLRLIDQLLSRHGAPPEPDDEALTHDLVARARRDAQVEVRIAATEALDRLDGAAVLAVLDEIADSDPDQRVRYAAEARAYDRRRRAAGQGPAD